MAMWTKASKCLKTWPETDMILLRSVAQISVLEKIFVQRYQTSCFGLANRKSCHRIRGQVQVQRSCFHSKHGSFIHERLNDQPEFSEAPLLKRQFSCQQSSLLSRPNSKTVIPWKSRPDVSPLVQRNSLLRTSKSPILVHQVRQGSFSPTEAILRSSPISVQPYLKLIRFDRPIGTWLLYWPCTWSIALAAQPGCMPDLKLLALFGAGAFFMRGAGCIINDMWDKDYDAKVERTKLRPLASGELTRFQALVFLGTQLSCALAILLQLNWYSVFLGASSMGLVVAYPLAKRYTYWPQLVLGLTLNWGVLLGWSQLHGCLEPPALALYAACTLYTMIYDSIYSHQDKYDDMLIGVKSTALKLGDQTKPWLSAFGVGMAGGLTLAGILCDMTWPYYLAVAITTGRLGQQIYSTDLNNAEECAQAFKGNFYLGAVMFAGIILANTLKTKNTKEENQTEVPASPS